MSKIVIELQQACLNDSIPCSSLLLKAYAIAVKLGMKDTAEIFSHELNGYKNADKSMLPEYRRVLVNTEAYEVYSGRWIPVLFPAKSEFNKHSVVESITEIEKIDLAECDTLEVRLNADAQKIIRKATNMTEPMLVHQIFTAAQAASILQKVRKFILDWSLELESKGILGENLEFSDVEQTKARNMSITNIFNAPINGANIVATATNSMLNVNNTNSFDYEGVEKLLESVQKLLPAGNFTKDDLEKIQQDIDEIKESISKQNVPAVKGKLKDLADFCKEIAGNVIASGVWAQIQPFLC